jgi:hypothetical protein
MSILSKHCDFHIGLKENWVEETFLPGMDGMPTGN